MDNFRQLSYYLLGFLPSLFFTSRFLVQWIDSERKKKSVVTKLFWQLSLCGNILLALHYFIQLQVFFFVLQLINGFIAWRNLNLLKSSNRYTLNKSLLLLFSLLVLSLLLFALQCRLYSTPIKLLDLPAGVTSNQSISPLWHLFGAAGALAFASRFWMQWIEAEKTHRSQLGRSFFLVSAIGSLASLIYFARIQDWISALNTSFGLIPYIRNLFLLKPTLNRSDDK